MNFNEATQEIKVKAHTDLGESAESLGIVPGIACDKCGRGFTETWTNDDGDKRTYSWDACSGEIY